MTALRFSVLGPLTMTRGGTRCPIPGGKVRVLLAALLLRPNQFVTFDQLSERLWAQQRPRNPRRVLQTNIVRLRQSLELSEVIRTEAGGYMVRLEPDQLDLLEFQQLMRRAAATANPLLEKHFLHDALDLWAGPACADVESDTLHHIDVPPLTEQRLRGLERRIALDLELGADAALVAELRALTGEHPLRERLWAQLMTTLYRTGRQAEALGAYRAVTRLLKEELGIGPSADLHRLHQAILNQEHLPATRSLTHAPAIEDGPVQAQVPREEEPALGALVRTWRRRALLTQERLAGRAWLAVRTIRRLEAGELRRPRIASVRRLAEALGLDDAESAILVRAARGSGDGPCLVEVAPPRVPTTLSPDGRSRPPHLRSSPAGAGSPAGRLPEPAARWNANGAGLMTVTPRQLPADVGSFTGRQPELAALLQVDDATAGMVTTIEGMAGVGKTALAVHAAHELAGRFPDGNLFVDLHGHAYGVAPADPADVLVRMLEVLGVAGQPIPEHLDDRAALYRSVLAGRRMLILLDNAADEAQVRPLLPGEGGCLVLITSRRRLVGLDGAATVSVDVLPQADAVALFAALAGPRRLAGTTAEDLAQVVRRCGLLPLAIRLAAARLAAHPSWSVRDLLERLGRQRRGLSGLHAGQRSVSAALESSYRALPTVERRAYRLLGLHAGVDVTPEAAAALLGTTAARASVLLERLMEVHLLQEPAPGRYRFHGLIRAHAADEASARESEAGRHAALSRLLDHYSLGASAAMDRLHPYEAAIRPAPPQGQEPAPAIRDAGQWLEDELPNLLVLARYAAEHG
ncbi:helix-turn-helix domain-containing protein [Nonomuraea deserti]|uniref:Helix-turn-helix domain-containing protein n=1 Tax=Nonomuraea deserti TaxID=1848322 RepID=A0A4R4VEM9_9ACTN|nr:BTAD domain-containing putative transcriptional regulator [Nonomuraea deserti]TDD02057.1 helix-turn-helix domain-containing protein [Nonomuraea deserti]